MGVQGGLLDGMMQVAASWVRRTYGEASLMNRANRAARVAEEAVELVQAEGIPESIMQAIVARAYSRPVGEPEQESAGVLFTLLMHGYAADIDPVRECRREIARVEAIDPEHFRAKQREKFAAGTDLVAPHTIETSGASGQEVCVSNAPTDTLVVRNVNNDFKEVLRIDAEGRIFWQAREVTSDEDLRAALRGLAETLKANLFGTTGVRETPMQT